MNSEDDSQKNAKQDEARIPQKVVHKVTENLHGSKPMAGKLPVDLREMRPEIKVNRENRTKKWKQRKNATRGQDLKSKMKDMSKRKEGQK